MTDYMLHSCLWFAAGGVFVGLLMLCDVRWPQPPRQDKPDCCVLCGRTKEASGDE